MPVAGDPGGLDPVGGPGERRVEEPRFPPGDARGRDSRKEDGPQSGKHP
jgi:hypothetical protein